MYKFEVIASLKWYFESKNLSLSNAVKLYAPLSIEHQNDLRLYYSQYFASLVSATEYLLDKKYPFRSEFKALLDERFVFEGSANGEENYLYIKELRNSIVHRGYDIASAAHFAKDFPLLISPKKVKNQSGAKEHEAFRFYLIELINICEIFIGNIIAEHLENFAGKLTLLSNEEFAQESKKFIVDSEVMPDWVKEQALKIIDSEDFEEVKFDPTQEVLNLIRKNALPVELINQLQQTAL